MKKIEKLDLDKKDPSLKYAIPYSVDRSITNLEWRLRETVEKINEIIDLLNKID